MAYSLNLGGTFYSLHEPKIMGILNFTPDSFYDRSRVSDTKTAVEKTRRMLAEGMDILDLGAISSRPGAELPDAEEEWRRLESPLRAIVKEFPELPVSVDTFRADIARRCADCGATIINDISGGNYDREMFATMGALQLPYILMHLKEKPVNMQDNPHYEDVVSDLLTYFSEKIRLARMAGIHDIIIDPGFGFAKTLEHNYRLLSHLRDFEVLDVPLLAGMSRKSMLYKLLDCSPQEALNATTAANMLALVNGARILRVHDVKEAAQCVRIFCQYRRYHNINPDAVKKVS